MLKFILPWIYISELEKKLEASEQQIKTMGRTIEEYRKLLSGLELSVPKRGPDGKFRSSR